MGTCCSKKKSSTGTSWMVEPRSSTLFLKGLGEFLDVECKNNANADGDIKCPCIKCVNNVWLSRDTVTEHLVCNGIMKGYDALVAHATSEASLKTAEFARVGIWGTKSSGSPHNRWGFLVEKDHKLKMITIDHGDIIYSLMITTESKGLMHTSSKAGGWNGGETVSEVMFEDDEEIIGINGTVGTHGGYTVISSLSFLTNKKTHGPFGRSTDDRFSIPVEEGNFGGIYGLAGYYIDGIGVYMRASSNEITRVGVWGTESPGGPQNQWSFQLERNHHLKKITIDHGDLIYALTFTSEFRGEEQNSEKAGGWNGGDTVTEVTFSWDEEIIAINGTVDVSRGDYAGYTIISSLTFITNKKTHGPYGSERGTPFTVPWDKESFAGFYGRAGYFIEAIGVFLKATI